MWNPTRGACTGEDVEAYLLEAEYEDYLIATDNITQMTNEQFIEYTAAQLRIK